MRIGSLTLAAALAGCTALTDFDRRFGTGPEDPDGSTIGDAGGPLDASPDASPLLPDALPGNDAGNIPAHTLDSGAPTSPTPGSVAGTWLVDRDVRTSECNAPSFPGYTWTVSEIAGKVTVQTNSPVGSVQSLSGTHVGAVLELAGILSGNAGTNTVTMRLTLSSDGDTFVGDEASAPRCPTTRRVTGTRL